MPGLISRNKKQRRKGHEISTAREFLLANNHNGDASIASTMSPVSRRSSVTKSTHRTSKTALTDSMTLDQSASSWTENSSLNRTLSSTPEHHFVDQEQRQQQGFSLKRPRHEQQQRKRLQQPYPLQRKSTPRPPPSMFPVTSPALHLERNHNVHHSNHTLHHHHHHQQQQQQQQIASDNSTLSTSESGEQRRLELLAEESNASGDSFSSVPSPAENDNNNDDHEYEDHHHNKFSIKAMVDKFNAFGEAIQTVGVAKDSAQDIEAPRLLYMSQIRQRSQSFDNRTDFTGASTEVATNRAVDLAMERIRQIEGIGASPSPPPPRALQQQQQQSQRQRQPGHIAAQRGYHHQQHQHEYQQRNRALAPPVRAIPVEAKSLLSDTSITSTEEDSSFQLVSPPQLQQQQQQQQQQRHFSFLQSNPNNHNKNRLAQHVDQKSLEAMRQSAMLSFDDSAGSFQSHSISSSVGVDINGSLSEKKTGLWNSTRAQKQQQQLATVPQEADPVEYNDDEDDDDDKEVASFQEELDDTTHDSEKAHLFVPDLQQELQLQRQQKKSPVRTYRVATTKAQNTNPNSAAFRIKNESENAEQDPVFCPYPLSPMQSPQDDAESDYVSRASFALGQSTASLSRSEASSLPLSPLQSSNPSPKRIPTIPFFEATESSVRRANNNEKVASSNPFESPSQPPTHCKNRSVQRLHQNWPPKRDVRQEVALQVATKTQRVDTSEIAPSGNETSQAKAVSSTRSSQNVANTFLSSISKREQSSYRMERTNSKKTGQRRKKGLDDLMGKKKPRANADCDRPRDVKSIRSAFESMQDPPGTHVDESSDDDDDTASVKSLRDRFEEPPEKQVNANGICRMRSFFEKKKPPAPARFQSEASTMKEVFSKFEGADPESRRSSKPGSPPRKKLQRRESSTQNSVGVSIGMNSSEAFDVDDCESIRSLRELFEEKKCEEKKDYSLKKTETKKRAEPGKISIREVFLRGTLEANHLSATRACRSKAKTRPVVLGQTPIQPTKSLPSKKQSLEKDRLGDRCGSAQANEDNDVKATRNRFQEPRGNHESENGVKRMKSVFEKKKPPAPKRFETGTSSIKEVFTRFEVQETEVSTSRGSPSRVRARNRDESSTFVGSEPVGDLITVDPESDDPNLRGETLSGSKDGSSSLKALISSRIPHSAFEARKSMNHKRLRSGSVAVEDSSKTCVPSDEEDDCASVKGLREKFDEPPAKQDAENGISKVRSVFEKKKPPAPKRFQSGASNVKEVFSRFETVEKPVTSSKSITRGSSKDPNTVSEAVEVVEEHPLSVADRIRAFGRNQPRFANLSSAGDDFNMPIENDRALSTASGELESINVSTKRISDAPDFRENLKRFSGKLQQEEHAKLVATSAFRERISKFSSPPLVMKRNEIGSPGKKQVDDRKEPAQLQAPIGMSSRSTKNVIRPTIVKKVPSPGDSFQTKVIRPVAVKPRMVAPVVAPVPIKPLSVKSFVAQQEPVDQILGIRPWQSDPAVDQQASALSLDSDQRMQGVFEVCSVPASSSACKKEEHSESEPRSLTMQKPDAPSSSGYQPDRQATKNFNGTLQAKETASVDHTDTDSEFSDGVTLDLSIADVSCLTNPTAIVSRADRSVGTVEESVDTSKQDQVIVGKESSTGNKVSSDPMETEARRSEASSSQPSEAAAPLIAKAMRMIPMSDDTSTESFFTARALVARHWEKTSGGENGAREAAPKEPTIEEEPATTDDAAEEGSPAGKKDDGEWDIQQVSSSFPNTKTSSSADFFDFSTEWEAFPAFAAPFAEGRDSNSGSKTPTRANTSRPYGTKSRQKESTIEVSSSPTKASLVPSPSSAEHSFTANQGHGQSAPRKVQLRPFEIKPAPLPKVPRAFHLRENGESRPHMPWRGRPGLTVENLSIPAHAIPETSAMSVASEDCMSVRLPRISSMGESPERASLWAKYGPKHTALMARLRNLKEARLQRAASGQERKTSVFSPVPTQPTGLNDPFNDNNSEPTPEYDEYSNSTLSTRSSTRFGGSAFLAALEVD